MLDNTFDVVSWVKNGAWVLPKTLERLEEVLPKEFVHRKIAIDDRSTDDTVKILKDFGWEVYTNPKSGISSGANYGLSKVDCPYFMSFEQDLLLAKNWFDKVSALMKEDVGAVSGIRFSSKPKASNDLEHYVYRKYLMDEKLAPYLSGRKESAFTLGKTLDNTLYRTDVIREVGGFPIMPSSGGVDTVLAYHIKQHGFKWHVQTESQSVHIRKGLRQVLNHQKWYSRAIIESLRYLPDRTDVGILHSLNRLAMSPFVGVFVAIKMKNAMICVVHPLYKLYSFKGYLETS